MPCWTHCWFEWRAALALVLTCGEGYEDVTAIQKGCPPTHPNVGVVVDAALGIWSGAGVGECRREAVGQGE